MEIAPDLIQSFTEICLCLNSSPVPTTRRVYSKPNSLLVETDKTFATHISEFLFPLYSQSWDKSDLSATSDSSPQWRVAV